MDAPPLARAEALLSLSVKTTLEEYTAFSDYVLREKVRTTNIAFVVIGGLLITVGFLASSVLPATTLRYAVVLGAVSLSLPFVTKLLIRSQAKPIFKTSKLFRVSRRALLTEAGVRIEGSDGSESFTPWSAVEEIVVDRSALYVMLAQNAGLIVPSRAFTNEERYLDFTQFALGAMLDERHRPKEQLAE